MLTSDQKPCFVDMQRCIHKLSANVSAKYLLLLCNIIWRQSNPIVGSKYLQNSWITGPCHLGASCNKQKCPKKRKIVLGLIAIVASLLPSFLNFNDCGDRTMLLRYSLFWRVKITLSGKHLQKTAANMEVKILKMFLWFDHPVVHHDIFGLWSQGIDRQSTSRFVIVFCCTLLIDERKFIFF